MLPTSGIVLRLIQDAGTTPAQDAAPFDSIWATGAGGASSAFEQVMLSNDKLFVVLGVVLIIWAGLIFLLFRTDRRLAELERRVEQVIPDEDPLGPSPTTGPSPTD